MLVRCRERLARSLQTRSIRQYSVWPVCRKLPSSIGCSAQIFTLTFLFCGVDCWTMGTRSLQSVASTSLLHSGCHPSIKIHLIAYSLSRRLWRACYCLHAMLSLHNTRGQSEFFNSQSLRYYGHYAFYWACIGGHGRAVCTRAKIHTVL